MHPFNKPISEIFLADIQSLVQDQIAESRTLDYKRDLYSNSDRDKKEFLIDISALANTMGGYLIIGIDENDGIPISINGVKIQEFDKLKLFFENLLNMAVDPPIRGVEFHAVDIQDNNKVLIIEVPQSISKPHAVTIQKYHRFHGRNSSGTYPFEVDDIRQSILESETLASKIKNFRNNRLSMISTDNAPMPLSPGAKTILHLIPNFSLYDQVKYNIQNVSPSNIPPFCTSRWNHRINFDGFLTYLNDPEEGLCYTYTQIFHNGIIEAVDALMLDGYKSKKGISSNSFELEIIQKLRQYIETYIKISINFPIWICLSLIGVKNYVMLTDNIFHDHDSHPIDRNELILPEIFMEYSDTPCETIMKSSFDTIWQSCGLKRSLNYNEDGSWKFKR